MKNLNAKLRQYRQKTQGSVLLYVLIIWAIIALLLSLVTIMYSSSIANTLQIQNFIQTDFLRKNLVENITNRYNNNYDDAKMYTQASGFSHTLTRYTNVETVFLNSNIASESYHFWEFHKGQRELSFLDTSTIPPSPFPNQLDGIQNWKISWNLSTNTALADVKTYNLLQRNESAGLRITLLKTGTETVKKCFNTSNPDVQGSITTDGAFLQSLTLSEAFFKSISLTEDCTESDPFDVSTFLNANGASPLDFENNSYILKVQALDSAAHVRLTAVGNSTYIPTNFLNIFIVPSTGGEALEKKVFVAGRGSLVFSLLSDAQRLYNGDFITSADQLTEESWEYFMQEIMSL